MQRRLAIGLVIVAIALVGLFLLFRYVLISYENPPVANEITWDSQQTHDLVERACFDCHSNETVYPWYAYVPPVSILISHDVEEGRSVLNFSNWGNARGEAGSAHEMAEVILEGEMPPSYYVMMHPDARLDATEKQQILDGLRATLANQP